jgi:hypothetical protein
MHFVPEITAPKDWKSVRIVPSSGLEPDVIEEFVAELRQTGLRVVEEAGAVLVERVEDVLAVASFVSGLVPDLETRGFRATWLKSTGI